MIFDLKWLLIPVLQKGSECKKANKNLLHKKNAKQTLRNFRPISMMSIFGKVFEKIIYNNISEYLTANKLIPENQSGFKLGDSCVNQLL